MKKIFRTGMGLLLVLVAIAPFRNLPAEVRTVQDCLSNEACNRCFQAWKKQIARKGMSDDYFNAHFSILNIVVDKQDGRTFFKIDYLFHIDWASIRVSDDYTVSFDNRMNTVDRITPLMPIDNLKYDSRNAALEAAQRAVKSAELKFDRLSYWVPGRIPRNDGYPYLLVRGTIDRERNKCLWGYLNLFNGEIQVKDTHCWID